MNRFELSASTLTPTSPAEGQAQAFARPYFGKDGLPYKPILSLIDAKVAGIR